MSRGFTNSPLVNHINISPHRNTPRQRKIDTITIHMVVGQTSVESLGAWFKKPSTKASSNYGVGYDGRIGLYVEEKDRAWTSSSGANDHRAVTIEVASDTTPPYAVRPEAYDALIALVTDVCKRNGIPELRWLNDPNLVGQVEKQNMTIHRWFASTNCPGEWLHSRMGQIAQDVNANLKGPGQGLLFRVQVGAYKDVKNATMMEDRLKRDGFETYKVVSDGVYKVQTGAFRDLNNAEALSDRLARKGYETYITSKAGDGIIPGKTATELAHEVYIGLWGNDPERSQRLKRAGYDADAVQREVNRIYYN